MASLNMRDIDLLLIGKTGNGKSRTGNSILRHKKFKFSINQTSETMYAVADWSKYNERIIKVVDTPGVGDTRLDTEDGQKLVIAAMEKAIAMNPRGYHAFLLVIRYGGRFTDEDVQTIEFLKAVFGKNFVRKYCILVMTCGDNFTEVAEETGMTFTEWCNEQTGVFKTLYDECEQRAVLFDNRNKDESTQLSQLDNLISLIDNLWKPGHRYTDENFMKAAEVRERVMIEAKEPKISERTLSEVSLLLEEKARINLKPLKERAEAFSELLTKADALFESVRSEDKGTDALKRHLDTVDSFRGTLKEEITICTRMSEEAAKLRQESQSEIGRLEKEIEKLKMSLNAMNLEKAEARKREIAALEKAKQDKTNKIEREIQDNQKAFERESRERMDRIEDSYRSARDESQVGLTEQVVSAVGTPFKLVAKGVEKILGWFKS